MISRLCPRQVAVFLLSELGVGRRFRQFSQISINLSNHTLMFEKFYGSFFAVLSGICLVAQPLQAEQTYGDFIYTKSAEGVTITDFINSSAEEVVIPSSIDGKPVIGIGREAFYNRQSLTSVRIPESVTHIGDQAFCYCNRLMNLNLPSGLTSVGSESFAYCESLLSITMPSRMRYLGPGAFSNCRRLRSVSMSPSLTTINNLTFFYCLSLSRITIPEGVAQIQENAFGECHKLKEATFLGDAPIMGGMAFTSPTPGFTFYYLEGSTGFSTPTWQGYACAMISPNPEIEVRESAEMLRANGNAKRNFGKMFLDNSKRVKTFTVTNTGTAHLTDLVVKIKGVNPRDFKIITPIKSSLQINETTSFKVSFKPIRIGSRNAMLHITSDEMKSDAFDIKLIGRGKKLSNTEQTIK